MRKVVQTGMGVMGRPDPVAWLAMQDVMEIKARHRRLSGYLADARNEGQVALSLELCHAQMQCEHDGRAAVEVCVRMAGERGAKAAMAVGSRG